MQIFAVQTIPPGNSQSEFVLVSANDSEQALAFAAKQSIDAGKPDTSMVATFTLAELQALVSAMSQAQEGLTS